MRRLIPLVFAGALTGCQTVDAGRTPDRGARLITTAQSQRHAAAWRHKTLWCAEFANWTLEQEGLQGTGSRQAISFAKWGQPRIGPAQPGDILVTRRPGGDHVGFVIKDRGNAYLTVSGNHGHDVGEGLYPKRLVVAVRQAP